MKWKRLFIVLVSLLGFALFLRITPSFPARVILDFLLFKNKYVSVANHIESLGWEKYGLDQDKRFGSVSIWESGGNAINVNCAEEYRDLAVPQASGEVKQAVRFLFRTLRYSSIRRTSVSGNTIVFESKPPPLNLNYYNEGVCYVIDGGEPTPEGNLDYVTEYLQPLGDNWYYWNGHCYFAPSVVLPSLSGK